MDFPIKHGGSFHSFLYVYQRDTQPPNQPTGSLCLWLGTMGQFLAPWISRCSRWPPEWARPHPGECGSSGGNVGPPNFFLGVLNGDNDTIQLINVCVPFLKNMSHSISNWPGWWCNSHLEKYESMGRMTSHIFWKINNVWNHQPDGDNDNIQLINDKLWYMCVPFLKQTHVLNFD